MISREIRSSLRSRVVPRVGHNAPTLTTSKPKAPTACLHLHNDAHNSTVLEIES